MLTILILYSRYSFLINLCGLPVMHLGISISIRVIVNLPHSVYFCILVYSIAFTSNTIPQTILILCVIGSIEISNVSMYTALILMYHMELRAVSVVSISVVS